MQTDLLSLFRNSYPGQTPARVRMSVETRARIESLASRVSVVKREVVPVDDGAPNEPANLIAGITLKQDLTTPFRHIFFEDEAGKVLMTAHWML